MWMWSLPREKCRWNLLICSAPDELKSRFAAVGHADFWRKHILLTKRFPGLVDNAMRTVAAFDCTYCCEQLFSRMKLTKSKSRAQLTDGYLNDVLLLSVLSVVPDILSLSAQKQHQVSHWLISYCKLFFIEINVFPGCASAALTFLSVAPSLQKVGHPCIILIQCHAKWIKIDARTVSLKNKFSNQKVSIKDCDTYANIVKCMWRQRCEGYNRIQA